MTSFTVNAPKDRCGTNYRSIGRARPNSCSRAMSSKNSRRFMRPKSAYRSRRRSDLREPSKIRLESDAVRHRACIGIFEIAVARERPQGEKFRIAMVTKIEHAGETGGGVARLVPEA